jgi:hypothetical protein
MAQDHTPREGAAGRKTGVPSGKYPGEAHLAPRNGAVARSTGSPREAYPSESQLNQRDGAAAKMAKAGDPKTPDIPVRNQVDPKPWRPTPEPGNKSAPGASAPKGHPGK